MEGELVKVQKSMSDVDVNVPEDVIQVYMDSLFKDMSKPQAMAFVRMCNKKQLDWETRQIYPMKTKNSKTNTETITPIVSIDGLQTVAERTGKYGGIINSRLRVKLTTGEKVTLPIDEYDPEDIDKIISGTVEVVRTDFPVPQSATALFASYAKTYNGEPFGLWKQFPERMILKCAEALALRKAFPQDLSGLYSKEEMDQANNAPVRPVYMAPVVTAKVEVKPVPNPVEVKATDPPVIEVTGEPPVEVKKAKKEMSIVEIITKIPQALKRRKADIDPELFPFCEQLVLQHFEVEKAEDIPEDKREAVLDFLKNDLITHLKEHGEL